MVIDALGLGCAVGSVVLFGTNYLPVKKYDVGDGFFFQWCLCIGIWLVGICVDLAHPYSSSPPPFQPLAMLGGAIWCTGQLAVVTVVQTIGIAKGLIIWGSTAMLAGWACGVWGLLGVRSQADAVHSWALNLSGLALCLASLGFSLLLRPSVGGAGDEQPPAAAKVSPTMLEEQLLAPADGDGAAAAATGAPAWLLALDASQRSAVGVGLALCAAVPEPDPWTSRSTSQHYFSDLLLAHALAPPCRLQRRRVLLRRQLQSGAAHARPRRWLCPLPHSPSGCFCPSPQVLMPLPP